MPFIVGKKIKMTQLWNEEGNVIPVTLIDAGPVVVIQVKETEKDGYESFQVGYDSSIKKINKPNEGRTKNLGKFRYFREFKTNKKETYNVGDKIDVSSFKTGDIVKIVGHEKGRGYQGVVKRHGFHGGPKTHGQKNRFRAAGSIGATAPQRVIKGKKMAGHMGNDRVSIRSRVVGIDADKNLLIIKGQVPGSGNRRSLVLIQTINK